MIRIHQLVLPLEHSEGELEAAAARRLGITRAEIAYVKVAKRSHDARGRGGIRSIYNLDVALCTDARRDDVRRDDVRCDGAVGEDGATASESDLLERFEHDAQILPTPETRYHHVTRVPAHFSGPRPVVIGMGPCGLFAGLLLAEMGFEPLILERGKKVRERTVDTFGFWRKGVLDPESNVQFGEGGAGTFSDGKLYSQVRDPRHLGRKVLEEFVAAGAPEEILWVAKPHIGTFKLVKMVEHLRAKIEGLGGEIRFRSRVDDFLLDHGRLRGLVLADGEEIRTDHVVLAVGHSARDTFETLYERGVAMEAKPFSIGFRIEHPQTLIDRRRFGRHAGHPLLGAADYRLVHHGSLGRSVYSFCMCPGGTVVAAASEPGRVVTNGMSQYDRSERNANAGIVVGITPEDYPGHPLAGIAFQRRWEERAFEAGGGTYEAPGQRVGDFLAGRPSSALGGVTPSYKPGVRPGDLGACLPPWAIAAIREALPAFDRKLKGFAMSDALLTGVETRTSSPLRIPRGDDFQCPGTPGLFPAGEGAGYAGGILSAGIDGIRIAEAVASAIVGLE